MTNAVYVVKADGTVEYKKPNSQNAKSLTIPSQITVNGSTYPVTSIAPTAFANHKKLVKVTISPSVTTIGAGAFSGCKKLKTINIRIALLTTKSVGSKAFKGVYNKANFKYPKSKKTEYSKLFALLLWEFLLDKNAGI